MRREPSPRLQEDASGGGAQTPGWTGHRSRVAGRNVVSVVGLPSRPPSTQAEPSSRGPGRQGRSYSGALHLDALNHDRSTVCGSKADGMGAWVSGGWSSFSRTVRSRPSLRALSVDRWAWGRMIYLDNPAPYCCAVHLDAFPCQFKFSPSDRIGKRVELLKQLAG